MSGEYIPDLVIEVLAGGNVRLCQQAGCGEDALVDLHPIQVRLLAERAGLLPAAVSDGGVAARRLRIVTDKLCELAAAPYYRDEIVSRSSMGGHFITELDALCDLAVEFAEDVPVPTHSNVQRRLQRIAEDATDLHGLLASVPSFPPSAEEDEDVARARRLVEDIELLLEDITEGGECHENCHDKSAAISVTQPAISVTSPDAPKRGRPTSGKAMTDAERQARRREKQQGQQELLPTEQGDEHDHPA